MINELCLTARAFGTVENCSSYFSVTILALNLVVLYCMF